MLGDKPDCIANTNAYPAVKRAAFNLSMPDALRAGGGQLTESFKIE
jgi:hypothetical protein